MTTTEQPTNTESPEAPAPVATPETAAPAKDAIITKAPTGLHRRYAKYIVDKFGFDMPGAEAPEDFFDEGNPAHELLVKIVQIAVVKYGEYQKSPENAEYKALEAARKESERAKADAEKKRVAEEKAAAKAKADEAAAAAKTASGTSSEGTDEAKTRKPAASKPKAGNAPEAPF